jgi:hypothetical protein
MLLNLPARWGTNPKPGHSCAGLGTEDGFDDALGRASSMGTCALRGSDLSPGRAGRQWLGFFPTEILGSGSV